MRVLLTALFFLSLTSISFGQNLEIEDGYYRINSSDDDYDWIVHIEGMKVDFYVNKELAFSFAEESAVVTSDSTFIRYTFKNPLAKEYQEHFFELKKIDGSTDVEVSYAVEEYVEFFEKDDIVPKSYSTSYFTGPLTKEEVLGN